MAIKLFFFALIAVLSVQGFTEAKHVEFGLEKADEITLEKLGECFLKQKKPIQALIKKTKKDVKACSHRTLPELEKLVAEWEKLIVTGEERLVEHIKEIKACADDACKAEVVKSLIQETLELNEKANALAAQAKELIENADPKVAECLNKVLLQVRESALAILEKVQVCVGA